MEKDGNISTVDAMNRKCNDIATILSEDALESSKFISETVFNEEEWEVIESE